MGKESIKKILREGVSPDVPKQINTFTETDKITGVVTSEASSGQYARLRQMLKNDLINHSGIIRRMKGWGNADATERSLFKKKVDMAKNDEGGIYKFTKEEVEDIFHILDEMGKQMSKTDIKSMK